MSRSLWFVAGAGAGVYAVTRVQRVAEVFTPDGLRDRVAGLGLGARLVRDEVRTEMHDRETELRERLAARLDGPPRLEPPGARSTRPVQIDRKAGP